MRDLTLTTYNRKRNFRLSPEPPGKRATPQGALRFVVQKHAARQLHYDFRLEWDGVLRSWAVPKGPSLDPAVKRMAVEVEDHPLSYRDFEGIIPEGHYGAGSVVVWDRGTWKPVGDAARSLRDGKLKFTLDGQKLKGGFTLVRTRPRNGGKHTSWLLIKERDALARAAADFDVVEEKSESVSRKPQRRRALPLILAPQLATLVTAAPQEGDWLYEMKFDGYRLLTRIQGKDVRCFTRNGHDWTRKVPGIVEAARQLDVDAAWLDGEIIVPNERGVPDFQRLQNAFESGRTGDIRYFIFDLLFHDGEDLREKPLRERRGRLKKVLGAGKTGALQFSVSLEGNPAQLLAAARAAGMEGLVGKRADGTYQSGRSRDWIKLKTGARQEFVIGGFSEPQGSRSGLGSLLLGVYDADGKLRYAGNVGTGFSQRTLDTLRRKLDVLETASSPFHEGPARVGTVRKVAPHWVKPKLVAEIGFAEWTAAGHVRQAVFHGLRDDKPARQIIRESPKVAAARVTAAAKVAAPARGTKAPRALPVKLPATLRVTHPERVIDKESGTTKGELIAYYAQVSQLLLPHLKDRPVSLLRAPEGVAGEQFFQKHAQGRSLPQVQELPRELDPEHAPLLEISSSVALLSAAQMNVIELHTWNATADSIEQPDRMVFDLDPGTGVTWPDIREAATLVRTMLDELSLTSFLKTSGGKGLHVVVPLKRSAGWDEVKAFSQHMVEHLAAVIPQRFVAKSGPRNRVGRIFVDYLRNGRGATTVAAWSARARPGMGISVPLAWDELGDLQDPPQWTVRNFAERLAAGNSPWQAYEKSRQLLGAAMRKLGFTSQPAAGRARVMKPAARAARR